MAELADIAKAKVGTGEATLSEIEEAYASTHPEEAKWDSAYKSALPNSAFALIYKKDGKIVRKLPYKDKNGAVDVAHLRNALARIKHVKDAPEAKLESARKKLASAAKKHLRTYKKEMFREDLELQEVAGLCGFAEYYDEPEMAIWGATTFEDYEAAQEVKEFESDVRELVRALGNIVDGIMSVPGDGKGQLLKNAAAGFSARVDGLYGNEASTEGMHEFAESASGRFLEVDEAGLAELKEAEGDAQPRTTALVMRQVMIEPGWGNTRDNNYYPKEVLARDAHILEGVKMYVTNHIDEEVNVRNEVAQILKCPDGFTETGGPIAKIGIFDPDFARNVRNRKELDELSPGSNVLASLQSSICAYGEREKNFKKDGREGFRVTELTSAKSVDFVPQAGAGGRGVELLESAADTNGGKTVDENEKEAAELKAAEEKAVAEKKAADEKLAADEKVAAEKLAAEEKANEPTFLSESEVKEAVLKTNLPEEAKAKLIKGQYADLAAVEARASEEAEYVRAITGSGQPFSQGSASATARQTDEEHEARVREIYARHSITLQGKE